MTTSSSFVQIAVAAGATGDRLFALDAEGRVWSWSWQKDRWDLLPDKRWRPGDDS
jgi:hypothetical protein